MVSNQNQIKQVEGQWDDLIRHSDQFAGRPVRATVLLDEKDIATSLQAEIRQWLVKGDTLKIISTGQAPHDGFGNALVEKFRKQGLVL